MSTDVIVVPNPSVATAAGEVEAPLRDGRTPYRFEMTFDDGKYRAYADDAEALLGCLIRGYDQMAAQQRMAARLHLAVRTQTTVQAAINTHFGLDEVTPEEYAVLQATRATPPDVTEWNSHVPLVLVDTFYQPFGTLPVPMSAPVETGEFDNLMWLRPSDPYDFLTSLAELGLISLFAHVDYTP